MYKGGKPTRVLAIAVEEGLLESVQLQCPAAKRESIAVERNEEVTACKM